MRYSCLGWPFEHIARRLFLSLTLVLFHSVDARYGSLTSWGVFLMWQQIPHANRLRVGSLEGLGTDIRKHLKTKRFVSGPPTAVPRPQPCFQSSRMSPTSSVGREASGSCSCPSTSQIRQGWSATAPMGTLRRTTLGTCAPILLLPIPTRRG